MTKFPVMRSGPLALHTIVTGSSIASPLGFQKLPSPGALL
jgi:hypothetical protein